ncbi:MAG: hypothetical protein H7843_08900 [Nitrospirota bacterium]
MQTDFRHRMEHLGDYFVDMIDKVSEAARCSAKGVILTYDIHFLKKRKEGLINDLGARVAELRKTAPEQIIFEDENIREILVALDETEKKYDEFVAERQSRLSPASTVCSCSGTLGEAHMHDEGHTHTHEEMHAHDEGHDEGHVHEAHTHDEGHVHTHEELHTHDEEYVHEGHTHDEGHTHEEVHEETHTHEEAHDEPHAHDELHTHDEPHTHEESHEETTDEPHTHEESH